MSTCSTDLDEFYLAQADGVEPTGKPTPEMLALEDERKDLNPQGIRAPRHRLEHRLATRSMATWPPETKSEIVITGVSTTKYSQNFRVCELNDQVARHFPDGRIIDDDISSITWKVVVSLQGEAPRVHIAIVLDQIGDGVLRLVAGVGLLLTLIYSSIAGAEVPPEDIEAGSGTGGTEVVTVVDVGETGGGYSGSDGVMDCRWMAIGDHAGNTHESYTVADLGAMVLGETYLFQCFLLATGEEVVHEFRNWDPAAPAPVIDLTTVAYNWAVRSLDRQPLPPPPIVTAPPAGVPTLVNVANFYWTTLPGQHMAES